MAYEGLGTILDFSDEEGNKKKGGSSSLRKGGMEDLQLGRRKGDG